MRDRPQWPYNETTFEVDSHLPALGDELLAFSVQAPEAINSDVIPGVVILNMAHSLGSCTSIPMAGGPEPIEIGTNILRAGDGGLMHVRSNSAVAPGGVVETGATEPLPFDLKWVDAGCQPCGEYGFRNVAFELTMKGANGTAMRVVPGERKAVMWNGLPYLFTLSYAYVYRDEPRYCLNSHWMFFRKDLVIELYEDGGVKASP